MGRVKLKSLPEDFRVEEITSFHPSGGPFAFYRLSKRSIGTPEAIQAVLSYWNLSRNQVSYGGLKDRHAVTSQYLTLFQGPRQSMQERSFELEYLGQAGRPYAAADIDCNRFHITLRGIPPQAKTPLESQAQQLQANGILNYFDDQRFGSLGDSGDFIGRAWCLGDYERALFLAMADPNSHDRPREREQKEILRTYWGQWDLCKDQLDRSHRRSVVTYLCDHPQDFKRAIGLIRIDLRSIYVAAFQSHLWNQWVSAIILDMFGDERSQSFPSRCGPLRRPSQLTDQEANDLAQLELPLPSARQKEYPDRFKPLLEQILSQLGMTLHQIRLKYPRDTFFSKGSRAVFLHAQHLSFAFGEDDLHPGRHALHLKFQLPKGSYATMIVKHLSQVVEELESGDNDHEEQ